MSCLIVDKVYEMGRGKVRTFAIDAGESTAGSETGVLANGVTVSSGTVAAGKAPSGASALTLGSVSVISSNTYVNGRQVSANEGVTFTVTAGASQAYGRYTINGVLTLSNSDTVDYVVKLDIVEKPS